MTPARWTPTRADVRAAARTARLSLPFLARNASRLAGVVLLLVIGVLLAVGVPALSALGAPLGLILLGAVIPEWMLWTHNLYVRQPVEATLTDDELVHTGTGTVRFLSAWPWTAFRYAVETPDQFVLVGAKEKTGFVPYVPKRAVEDPAAVRAFLAERLEVRSPRPGPRWSRRPGSAGTGSARSSSGS